MAGGFVVVRLDEVALRDIGKQELVRRANRVKNRAQQLAPVDKGVLRSSIGVEYRGDGRGMVARVGSSVDYALYVHEGTGLYGRGGLIRPVRAKVLAWRGRGPGSRGGMVFRAFSRGSRGRPFLRDALSAFDS